MNFPELINVFVSVKNYTKSNIMQINVLWKAFD